MAHFGKIESLDFFGNGILHHDGKCCFIKNALPFEEIMYELTEERKSYARGETVELLAPSLQRLKPPCPYYGACGGCDFQHIGYPGEAIAKQNHVRRLLTKVGGEGMTFFHLEPPRKIFGYRNHVNFHMKDGVTCFYREMSHDYVDISRCDLLEGSLNQAVAEVNHLKLTGATSLSLRTDNTGHVFAAITGDCQDKSGLMTDLSGVISGVAVIDETGTKLYGNENLCYDLDGVKLTTSFRSFFQVNTEMAAIMLRYCKELLVGVSGGVLLDLYCGVGSIGLYLAPLFEKVYGIEIVKDAAQLATENAVANNVDAEYITGKTENRLKDLLKNVPQADTVILDPPRQGLQKNVAKTIAAYGAKNILYISCDPSSLCRDLTELTKTYKVVSAKPFDLFPRTAHVETVVLMSRAKE